MKKAIIFDLDGTLINSLQDLADSCNYALQKNGFNTHEVLAYKYFVGDGLLKLIERILPQSATEADKIMVKKDFDIYYNNHYCDKTAPYEGVFELLESLKSLGIKLCIFSNKPHLFAVEIVNRIFKEHTFDLCFGKRDHIPKKPDPSTIYEILNELHLTADDIVYVGDSGVDMQTGKNAGIFSVGVLWGFRDENELVENGADAVISSPKELLKYFG